MLCFFLMIPRPPRSTLFPTTALFRSESCRQSQQWEKDCRLQREKLAAQREEYAQPGESERAVMAPAIRDLEERVLQMALEMDSMRRGIRNAEINDTK